VHYFVYLILLLRHIKLFAATINRNDVVQHGDFSLHLSTGNNSSINIVLSCFAETSEQSTTHRHKKLFQKSDEPVYWLYILIGVGLLAIVGGIVVYCCIRHTKHGSRYCYICACCLYFDVTFYLYKYCIVCGWVAVWHRTRGLDAWDPHIPPRYPRDITLTTTTVYYNYRLYYVRVRNKASKFFHVLIVVIREKCPAESYFSRFTTQALHDQWLGHHSW